MRKKDIVRALIAFGGALVILIVGLVLLQRYNNSRYQEKRGEMTEGFGELRKIEWNGVTYQEKPAVSVLLFAGIDKVDHSTDTRSNKYRNGGQADFLMLVAIDHTSKQIHQLQIDRDTMAEVVTLGIFGNETGTRSMQICLAHSFGETAVDNARYTVRAVQNLLNGIVIDGYYIVDYSALSTFNDALGGITVHVDYDMTSVNSAWTKGSTVTLHGDEAQTFVRARMTIGAGTNEERMNRHREFMQSAIAQMNRLVKENPSFCDALIQEMQRVAVTNLSVEYLESELLSAYAYEILPVDYLEGEYRIGSEGFMEFHMRPDSAVEWVLRHLYTK